MESPSVLSLLKSQKEVMRTAGRHNVQESRKSAIWKRYLWQTKKIGCFAYINVFPLLRHTYENVKTADIFSFLFFSCVKYYSQDKIGHALTASTCHIKVKYIPNVRCVIFVSNSHIQITIFSLMSK